MKLVIEKIPPWDGQYEMDGLTFTNREMHRIKVICGLRGGEVLDGLTNDDRGAYVAVAAVVLERLGKNLDIDELWEGEAGSIWIDARTNGSADARPPDEGSSAGSSSEDPANATSSGEPSVGPGE